MDEDHASLEDSILSFVEYPFVPYLIISSINQCLKTLQISQPIDSYGKLWKLGCQNFVVVVVVAATTIDMGKQNPLSKLCFDCPTQNRNTRTYSNFPTR
jgi:hypothetical protein